MTEVLREVQSSFKKSTCQRAKLKNIINMQTDVIP